MFLVATTVTIFVLILFWIKRPFHSRYSDSSGLDGLILRVEATITIFLVEIDFFVRRWIALSLSYFSVLCIRKAKVVINGVEVFYLNPSIKGADRQRCLIYIHGGGFALPHIYLYDLALQKIGKMTGCLILSINYRLAPLHIYPSAHDDCYNVVKYILLNPTEFNIDPTKVVVCGDSAGGNLVASTCLRLAENDGHLVPMIKAQILVCPWIQCVDFSLPSYKDEENYTPTASRRLLSNCASLYLTGSFMYSKMFLENNFTNRIPGENCDFASVCRSYGVSKEALHNVTSSFMSSLLTREYPSCYPETYVMAALYDVVHSEDVMFHEHLEKQGLKSTLSSYKSLHDGFLFSFMGRQDDVKMLNDVANIINSTFTS